MLQQGCSRDTEKTVVGEGDENLFEGFVFAVDLQGIAHMRFHAEKSRAKPSRTSPHDRFWRLLQIMIMVLPIARTGQARSSSLKAISCAVTVMPDIGTEYDPDGLGQCHQAGIDKPTIITVVAELL